MRTLTLIRTTVSPADPPVTLRVVAHTHLVKLLGGQGLLEKAWMEEGRVGLRPCKAAYINKKARRQSAGGLFSFGWGRASFPRARTPPGFGQYR